MKKITAKSIIKKYNLKAPVNLKKIIEFEGIEIRHGDLLKKKEEKEVYGIYVPKENKEVNNKKPIIVYSTKSNSNNFIRFIIAHELAHYFLEPNKLEILTIKNFKEIDNSEREINMFALNLLIPNKENFIKLLNNNFSDSDISNKYEIPLVLVDRYRKENWL